MHQDRYILVLNGGSSSLKFALYHGEGRVGHGQISGIGVHPNLKVCGPQFEGKHPPVLDESCRTPSDATRILITWLETCLPEQGLYAVGHRVVHGGSLGKPLLVTPPLMDKLRSMIPLAPLHQPFNIEVIDLIARLHPQVPQVACFDTSFHVTMADLHTRFALPRAWHDKGIRRYGFHGLSYEYIAGRLKEVSPRANAGRTVVAHLGNGSSLCALKNGRSFETSMGFSTLEGLIMGTRTGSIDPGVILYMLLEDKMDVKAVERLLYRESGLLGVSGISADMADLSASAAPEAREAIDLYCLQITRQVGALQSVMGGMDALVFTAGIGEHAVGLRSQVARSLAWSGLVLDEAKNAAADGSGDKLVSAANSAVEVWVMPTNEEAMIVRHTQETVQEASRTKGAA